MVRNTPCWFVRARTALLPHVTLAQFDGSDGDAFGSIDYGWYGSSVYYDPYDPCAVVDAAYLYALNNSAQTSDSCATWGAAAAVLGVCCTFGAINPLDAPCCVGFAIATAAWLGCEATFGSSAVGDYNYQTPSGGPQQC